MPTGRTRPRPARERVLARRVRARDGVFCLFNLGRPAPALPEQCEAFAAAVADELLAHGRQLPAPGCRLEIEDQDGNHLAFAVVQPWAAQPAFALFSPTGDLLTTWPPAGGREVGR